MRTRGNRFAPQQRINSSCLRSGNAAGSFAQRRMCWSGAVVGLHAGTDAGVEVLRHALPSNGVLYAQPPPDRSADLSVATVRMRTGGGASPSAFRTTALLLPTLGAELAEYSEYPL
jgi:hypothetical protein